MSIKQIQQESKWEAYNACIIVNSNNDPDIRFSDIIMQVSIFYWLLYFQPLVTSDNMIWENFVMCFLGNLDLMTRLLHWLVKFTTSNGKKLQCLKKL